MRERAPEDTNGGLYPPKTAMPTWVRSAAYLVGTFGFPIVVAAFLLLQSAGYIGSPLMETRVAMAEVRDALAAHIQQERRVIRLLSAICFSAARTDSDRERCITASSDGRGELP